MCRFSSDIVGGEFEHRVKQNHTVFFYHEDSGEMYVGGTDFVLKLDVDNYCFKEVGVSPQTDFDPLFLILIFSFSFFYHLRNMNLIFVKLSQDLLTNSELDVWEVLGFVFSCS